MDSDASIIIHFPGRIKIYMVVNSNWWPRYIGANLDSVHACFIAEMDQDYSQVTPIGS